MRTSNRDHINTLGGAYLKIKHKNIDVYRTSLLSSTYMTIIKQLQTLISINALLHMIEADKGKKIPFHIFIGINIKNGCCKKLVLLPLLGTEEDMRNPIIARMKEVSNNDVIDIDGIFISNPKDTYIDKKIKPTDIIYTTKHNFRDVESVDTLLDMSDPFDQLLSHVSYQEEDEYYQDLILFFNQLMTYITKTYIENPYFDMDNNHAESLLDSFTKDFMTTKNIQSKDILDVFCLIGTYFLTRWNTYLLNGKEVTIPDHPLFDTAHSFYSIYNVNELLHKTTGGNYLKKKIFKASFFEQTKTLFDKAGINIIESYLIPLSAYSKKNLLSIDQYQSLPKANEWKDTTILLIESIELFYTIWNWINQFKGNITNKRKEKRIVPVILYNKKLFVNSSSSLMKRVFALISGLNRYESMIVLFVEITGNQLSTFNSEYISNLLKENDIVHMDVKERVVKGNIPAPMLDDLSNAIHFEDAKKTTRINNIYSNYLNLSTMLMQVFDLNNYYSNYGEYNE